MLISLEGLAQSEEQQVKEAVNKLFEGMKNRDTALIRSAFSEDAIMQTVAAGREGKVQVHSMPVDTFLMLIAKPDNRKLEEKISFETVRIDGSLAMAWTPYRFYLDDRLMHCGVNSFQLVKLNGSWKIQYIIDTRRRQPCD